jgi:hypothetical protein
VFLPSWPSAEAILLRPGLAVGLISLCPREGMRRYSDQKFLKNVSYPQFRLLLLVCTDDVSYTRFSRENAPLTIQCCKPKAKLSNNPVQYVSLAIAKNFFGGNQQRIRESGEYLTAGKTAPSS